MEDTVTLTVSYTCLIRDRAMAKISRGQSLSTCNHLRALQGGNSPLNTRSAT